MNIDKILVYCPMAPEGVERRALEGMFGLAWEGGMDLMFGRSEERRRLKSDGTSDAAGNGESYVREEGRRNEVYVEVLGKYQQARRAALGGGYDGMLTIEADMIVPSMALERLWRVEADVAYGLYCSRHGKHQWLAYAWLNEENGESVQHGRTWCEEAWGKAAETAGVGLGCTLIRRKVLERIEFRLGGPMANDWYFALDVRRAGFVQKHDFGVACGHIDRDNGGRVYWPVLEEESFYRVEE